MFGNSSLIHMAGQLSDQQIDDSFALHSMAARRFWRVFAGSVWQRMRALAGREPAGLQSLKLATRGRAANSSQQLGILAVPIDLIRGSEGKSEEFDGAFRPLKLFSRDRWVSVAVARMQGKSLPPVELIKVDETYFVRDGHHRISVARAFGQQHIDATVLSM